MVLSIPRKVSLAVSMEELERIHAIISSPVMIAGTPVPAAVVALAAVTLVVWLLVMVRRIPPLRLPPHFTQQAASPNVCGSGFRGEGVFHDAIASLRNRMNPRGLRGGLSVETCAHAPTLCWLA